MPRKAFTTTPSPLRMPKVPQFTEKRRRVAERGGIEISPLAGAEIDLPPEADEELMAQFEAWNAATAGSLPEFIVWKFLVEEKKQRVGSDFFYQHPVFGGRTSFGGFVLDFWLPARNEAWQVNGLRWHVLHTEDRARDKVAKQLLSSRGLRVIDLWEDSLLTYPDRVLNLAWDHGAEEARREMNG